MGRTMRWRQLLAVLVPILVLPAPAYANIPMPVTADVLLRDLLIALTATVVIETAVAGILRVRGKALAVVALMNAVTNPLFNIAMLGATRVMAGFALFVAANYAVFVLEVMIIVVEWRILLRFLEQKGWTPGRVAALSVVMNLVSWIGGGLLIAHLFWPHWSPIWM